MGLLLMIAGLGLLGLPGMTARLGRRLPPSEWAPLCHRALAAGATSVEMGAILYATPTVLRAAGVPALASACERMLGGFLPGGAAAGWAAMATALVVPTLAAAATLGAVRGCRAVRVEPLLGAHHRLGAYELVVLPSERLLAVSVAGEPGQILISEGLVGALTTNQLDLVIRHEQAHLDLDHERILRLAAAVDRGFALWWPVRRSTAALRTALERWADELAAGTEPAGRADLRSALLAVSAVAAEPGVAAFSPADTVAERVTALERQPSRPPVSLRCAVYVPGGALAATLLTGVVAWGGEAHTLLSMVGRCG